MKTVAIDFIRIDANGNLFAFNDAFGCSRSLATFYDGIWVLNYLAAFTAHIKTALAEIVFIVSGANQGFIIAFYGIIDRI
jgi:hypothetical protein